MSTAMDEKDRYKIESQLTRPLPGRVKAQKDDLWAYAAEDGAAFLSAMGQQSTLLGGG